VADFDFFASHLLEEAKRFLERAVEAKSDAVARDAYLHASLLLAFSGLEAHVNAIADEFATRTDLTPHERGILTECDVRLESGEFALGTFRMYRLEDRILFLHRRFSGHFLDTQAPSWSQFKDATLLRNKLTHPKEPQVISVGNVELAISAIISVLDNLYVAIYKRSLPAAGFGLGTPLNF